MFTSKAKNRPPKGIEPKVYESETLTLETLRLIAAPNPKDDLSDQELEALCKSPSHSAELIQHLIEFIKTI
jgi:hypothetical protein